MYVPCSDVLCRNDFGISSLSLALVHWCIVHGLLGSFLPLAFWPAVFFPLRFAGFLFFFLASALMLSLREFFHDRPIYSASSVGLFLGQSVFSSLVLTRTFHCFLCCLLSSLLDLSSMRPGTMCILFKLWKFRAYTHARSVLWTFSKSNELLNEL